MSLPSKTDIYPVLLKVLDELGGRARPTEVCPRVAQHFPQIQPEELTATLKHGGNRWHSRIHWVRLHLARAGLIDPSTRGVGS